MDKIGLAEKMSDMEFIIHMLNNLPEEYNVVLDRLDSHLVSINEDKLTLEALWEELNSRFEQISSKEREKECHKKAWTAGFHPQFKGTFNKCGQYDHKTDSPKFPENGTERETRAQKAGIPRVVDMMASNSIKNVLIVTRLHI